MAIDVEARKNVIGARATAGAACLVLQQLMVALSDKSILDIEGVRSVRDKSLAAITDTLRTQQGAMAEAMALEQADVIRSLFHVFDLPDATC